MITVVTTKRTGVDEVLVAGAEGLLEAGVEKTYAHFNVRLEGRLFQEYMFVFETEAELDRAVRDVRAELKRGGATMRQTLRDTGAWGLRHIA